MEQQIFDQLKKTLKASKSLALISEQKINKVLIDISEEIPKMSEFILKENKKDLDRMDKNDPKYDRLKLTKGRLEEISNSINKIAELESPIDEIIEEKRLVNGLDLKKVRVPLGVICVIFEARPNVFFDCFALCFKTNNAAVLKGSKDAENSNNAIFELIKKVLKENGIDENIIYFPPSNRKAVDYLFKAHGLIDVIIPRGGQELIDFVRDNSRIPVIETGAGIVHTYLDKYADNKKAIEIIFNAKTQRPSVCNALDCLIVHEDKLDDLSLIVLELIEKNVEIFADEKSFAALENKYPKKLLKKADEKSFGTEFLSLKMSIKTVGGIYEAIDHIDKYSSRHSEAIISENKENIDLFFKAVDAAVVYSNASTRFTDGGVFELGAEIGISTQKLHARGPMGLREITSYKWVISGDGQVRN